MSNSKRPTGKGVKLCRNSEIADAWEYIEKAIPAIGYNELESLLEKYSDRLIVRKGVTYGLKKVLDEAVRDFRISSRELAKLANMTNLELKQKLENRIKSAVLVDDDLLDRHRFAFKVTKSTKRHQGGGLAFREKGKKRIRAACEECYLRLNKATAATFPDKEGRAYKLCNEHAKIAGTFYRKRRCSECSTTASFKDADGNVTLCAKHARAAGTHKVRYPCVMCPKGQELQANYDDKEGKQGQLCSKHAKEAGTYRLRFPCVMCLPDIRVAASYPDAKGNPQKLCTRHAKVEGSYKLRYPCAKCPNGSKKTAHFPDEAGRALQLCANHAKRAGTYFVRDPCEMCPIESKNSASYPSLDGRKNKLCAGHARLEGTFVPVNACLLCPENAKLEANYSDSQGNKNRYCSLHARQVGTYVVRNACVHCPEDSKLSAAFPDAEGNKFKLCAQHAVAAGVLAKTVPRASRVACECWDRLGLLLKVKLNHIHLAPLQNPVGYEYKVPGTRLRVDAWVKKENEVHLYEFLGNLWHGYPPNHPQFNCTPKFTVTKRHVRNSDAYSSTFKRFGKILKAGQAAKEKYRLFYVWEHEYKETARMRHPRSLLSIVKEFTLEKQQ